MLTDKVLSAVFLLGGAALALSGLITYPVSLLLGLSIALILGNPLADKTKLLSTWLMAIAIVGLGAGTDLATVFHVGASGILYTVTGIALAFAFGLLFGKLAKVDRETSLLITAGTAICGGSAIAAVSQVIKARSDAIAVSLGIVFLLNAAALFIFPALGHYFHLSQTQFGLWAALAIHDTSSVIGASLAYGAKAAEIGTTIKLTRALWIIPLAFVIGIFWSKGQQRPPVTAILKRCWFIAGFLIVAALATWLPQASETAHMVDHVAKRLMILVLFLIGAGLTRTLLRSVGMAPFVQGIALWFIVSAATLAAILQHWFHL